MISVQMILKAKTSEKGDHVKNPDVSSRFLKYRRAAGRKRPKTKGGWCKQGKLALGTCKMNTGFFFFFFEGRGYCFGLKFKTMFMFFLYSKVASSLNKKTL